MQRKLGGKEIEWTGCVQNDIRAFSVTREWKAAALIAEVWVETVTEDGRRFMAAWREEEVDAARHRQEKREATILGKLLLHTKAQNFAKLHPLSLKREITKSAPCVPLGELKSVSTIGGGGDTTIPSPGRSPKQSLPEIGLHDPLHGRQACPEFNSFHQGVGQSIPWEGLFSCHPLPKRGQICDIPAPPPNR